ncbi:hypothetical protein IIA15_10485, partial [candidate division TA06 bacterium]|nr:hypothetical protein [candidate division TA06 bacterium]
MNSEHLSPEEKLLRLIRKKRPKDGGETPSPSPQKPHLKFRIPSFSLRIPLGELFKRFGSIFKRRKGGRKPASFQEEGDKAIFTKINQGMALGFGVLLCFYLSMFFWSREKPESVRGLAKTLSQEEKTGQEVPEGEKDAKKPYTYYAADLEKRNLFGPSLYAETETVSAGPDILQESLKDLNLLGIISGKTPQAIIENKKEGKTHFVNPGDRIGPIRVEAIM